MVYIRLKKHSKLPLKRTRRDRENFFLLYQTFVLSGAFLHCGRYKTENVLFFLTMEFVLTEFVLTIVDCISNREGCTNRVLMACKVELLDLHAFSPAMVCMAFTKIEKYENEVPRWPRVKKLKNRTKTKDEQFVLQNMQESEQLCRHLFHLLGCKQ